MSHDPSFVDTSAPSAWVDLRADLKRYGRRPFFRELSVYAVVVYRFGRWSDDQKGMRGLVARRAYWILHRLAIALTNIEIPKEARFGPGLRIHHNGPVVVHPGVVAGSDCTLRHGVTLGERRNGGGVPTLGDGVELGSFSQVLGPVHIGELAKIGSLALVITDVPAHGIAFAPAAHTRTHHA